MIQHLKCKILVVIILLFNLNFQGQNNYYSEDFSNTRKSFTQYVKSISYPTITVGITENISMEEYVDMLQSYIEEKDPSKISEFEIYNQSSSNARMLITATILENQGNITQFNRNRKKRETDIISIKHKSDILKPVEVYFAGRSVGNIKKVSAVEYSHIKAKELYCDGESANIRVVGFSMNTTKNNQPITFTSKSDRLTPDMKAAIKKIPKRGVLVISNIKVKSPATGTVHIVPNSIVLKLM